MAKKKKIVVDSSVIVKWLNSQKEKYLEQADEILKDCEGRRIIIYTSELAKYEVGNAILYKKLNEPLTKSSLSVLYSLPIIFYPLAEESALRIVEIAAKSKITYYDAVFVNLAEEIGATLVTDNQKHQSKIKEVTVICLKDYKRVSQ